MSLLCKGICGMALIIPWRVPEMGVVSRPVLEVVEGTVVVWNRIWMSVVTEPPIKTGVDFMKLRKGKGVPAFESADSIRFRNVGDFFFV